MNTHADLTAHDRQLAKMTSAGGNAGASAALTLFDRRKPETLGHAVALVRESGVELNDAARAAVIAAWDQYRQLQGMSWE